MYTYKLGGMLITDELYHDDLEAMTFGRKDQNELMHYGIKGQSWGKRRFQNEDGSLTMAGRNRYDVGDPMKGVSAFADTGGRGGSGVNYNRLPGGTGGSTRSATANQAPARLVGSNPRGRATTSATTTQKVANTTNAGRKAADNLFGRIGNWASNAAKDVGDFATNTYNDASKAVTNAANDVGNAVKNISQDVSDWYTGDKNGKEAQRYDNVVQNFERNGERNINEGVDKISDSIDKDIDRIDIDLHGDKGDSSAHYAKNRDDLHDASNKQFREGLNQRNLGYDQHDIARQYGRKADEAQERYDAAPRQMLNAAGNWIGDRVSDAGNAVGNALKPGINAVGNAFNDAVNWVGDRANDVGNAVGDAYDSVRDTVNDAATGVRDWYTGEGDKRSADWYRDLSTRDTDWLGTGQNLIENHQAVANESREMAENLRKNGDYENAKRYEQNAEAYQRAADRMASDRNRNLSNAEMYDMRYDNAPRQVLSNLPGNITNAVSNAAKDVGDWASNAASDVRDWGAGALDKGRQAFESLFGRSEPPKAEKLDPTPKTFTENRIEEQRIPEQRITENRIEEQSIPEAIVREGEKYAQMTPDQRQARMDSQKNRPTVNGSNNVQTWDNANINTWDNVQTFGDPDMVNTIKMLNDNGFFNRGGSSNSGNNSSMSDKPSNVSDEYWRDYTSNGGTRESYDRELNARKNLYNSHSGQSLNNAMDYNAEQERLRNISSQQDKNGYRVSEVDTSRPHHFTYDPASGQTIVVYDDEKRR